MGGLEGIGIVGGLLLCALIASGHICLVLSCTMRGTLSKECPAVRQSNVYTNS